MFHKEEALQTACLARANVQLCHSFYCGLGNLPLGAVGSKYWCHLQESVVVTVQSFMLLYDVNLETSDREHMCMNEWVVGFPNFYLYIVIQL